jgi:IS5 family transposase
VIKGVFKAGHVLVTTVERVGIKMLFTAFGYNLYSYTPSGSREP